MSRTVAIGLGLSLLGLAAVLLSSGIEDRATAGLVKFLAGSLVGFSVGMAFWK